MPLKSNAPRSSPRMMEPGVVMGRWWHRLPDGRLCCDLCPRHCRLRPGQRGLCFVRQATAEGITSRAYGRVSGFCVDPIEKKPLNHFFPGSDVLSFGTLGCNLTCRFCQNWPISKAIREDRLSSWASPEDVARMAADAGCHSVAFTYNEPIVFAEYAVDCARAAHREGVRTVAVTAGYVAEAARGDFFRFMDAANVDLKAFDPAFYRRLCGGHLEAVLETLVWLKQSTSVWLEITTLLVPGQNDGEREIDRLCQWMLQHLGPDVPLHFSAFHPDFRMLAVPHTAASTLSRARRQARQAGLRHVYTGNVRDVEGQSTYCHRCGQRLIERCGYEITVSRLSPDGLCDACGARLAGRFETGRVPWDPRASTEPDASSGSVFNEMAD